LNLALLLLLLFFRLRRRRRLRLVLLLAGVDVLVPSAAALLRRRRPRAEVRAVRVDPLVDLVLVQRVDFLRDVRALGVVVVVRLDVDVLLLGSPVRGEVSARIRDGEQRLVVVARRRRRHREARELVRVRARVMNAARARVRFVVARHRQILNFVLTSLLTERHTRVRENVPYAK
jgi:hypothetical protein